MKNWYLKNFLNIEDFAEDDIVELLNLASQLKKDKQNNQETQYLKGKNIALIFEKTSTRTRCAFEVAAADQGASTTYLGPGSSQLGEKESTADTASVLGRFYDAIEYRGFSQETVNILAKHAGVPILNGLTDLSHPTQMLADLLTMQENSIKPLSQISFAYLGDARFNMGNSLLLTGALMGMDVRIAAPKDLQPQQEIIDKAKQLAKNSGARITISDDPEVAVKNVDFIHTDIWVSMGESKEIWQERLPLLMPYRIDGALLEKANNPQLKFMHCLPAYHDRETAVGEKFYEAYQLNGIEVADEVFSGSNSLVFTQAENRMHTIKALLVAVLSEEI